MMNRFLLLLGGAGLVGAFSHARADVWTTTEPSGEKVRTEVKRPDEPARDYSKVESEDEKKSSTTRRTYPSQSTTITNGASVPDAVNRLKPSESRVLSSHLTVGKYYPYYPYAPYPYYPGYPAVPYSGPIAPPSPNGEIPPWITSIPLGGYPAYPAYPYPNYTPAPGYYPTPGYYPAPTPYPYYQQPSWGFYGYSGPGLGGNGGYYSNQTNNTYGGITIGRRGPQVSVGGSRTTTSGSYSTFP